MTATCVYPSIGRIFTKILQPSHTPITSIPYNHRINLNKGDYDEKHIQENDVARTGRCACDGESALRQRSRSRGE